MKKYFRIICLICLAVLVSLTMAGCSRAPLVLQRTGTAMGTVVRQTLYVERGKAGSSEEIADETVYETAEAIFQCIDTLEQEYLSRRIPGAEINRVNRNADTDADDGKRKAELSDEMQEILEECLLISEASEGAFDITIAEVVDLWDLDAWAVSEKKAEFTPPEQTAIVAALEYTGYEKLQLQDAIVSIPEGMQLDLGAVGKGIALDRIRVYLENVTAKQENCNADEPLIHGAVVSVGGSILTYGSKPDGSAWMVGITDPADTAQNIGVLQLDGTWCISTSGDYERYVEVGEERYHHIIDPATGYPVDNGVRSVTVLCKNGLYSDALSTACFVLGEEKGAELAEKIGVHALFVMADGRITMTDEMAQYFAEGTGNG